MKSGKDCEAHAKQIERKQREDELLAGPVQSLGAGGGGDGGGDEDARLPKGAFKEVALHGKYWFGCTSHATVVPF